MADRFLLKQFAGQADNNGVFGSAQQGQGQVVSDLKQVQSLNSFEKGWDSATVTGDKLPCLEEFQGVSALAYKAIKELYSEGVPQWLSTETYYKDSFAVYNGKLYVNTTGSYTTNNPALDTTNWSDYTEIVKNALNDYFVRTTGNQTIDGIKTFTSPIITATNSSVDLRKRDYFGQYTRGNPPSVNLWGQHVHDSTGDELAQNLACIQTDGSYLVAQWVKSPIAGSTATAFGCHTIANSDGTFHTYAITPSADSNDTSIATTSWVRSVAGGGIPTGTILPFGGADDAIPNGYLLCNGGQISRTTYANLFAVIGTAYGDGDGSTTFNLPNVNNRYLGYNGRGYLAENLPNISGTIYNLGGTTNTRPSADGAFYLKTAKGGNNFNNGYYNVPLADIGFETSRSNSKYTSTNEVRPSTLRVNCIIKF